MRVSSAVSAITSPPGSPPERHYTQVPRVLPPEHGRPRPNPRRDTPPRTPVSPHPVRVGGQLLGTRLYQSSIPIQKGQQFEDSLTAPSLAAFPARLAPSFARLSGSSNSATNVRSRASPTASARPTISLTASCRSSKSPERANPALKAASRSFLNSGPPRTAGRARRFPYRAPQRVLARRRLSRRNSATTPVGTGLNRRIWARERIVGSTPSREVASSAKTVSPSGSSSVLSSAFAACHVSVSALRMNTRRALERPARRQTHYLPHLPDSRERPLGHYLRQDRDAVP